jgi:hypothetical protein
VTAAHAEYAAHAVTAAHVEPAVKESAERVQVMSLKSGMGLWG